VTTAGLLTVRADFGEGRLRAVDVDLRRPPVTQLFVGQSPEAVVRTVSCLYTICTQAQRAVAQAALAAAAGEPPQPADDAGLWIEMLHENLWRLLLDWPPALGLPPEQAAFIAWRATRQGGSCAEATRRLLTDVVHGLAENCLATLVDRNSDMPCGPATLTPDEWLAGCRESRDFLPAMSAPPSIRAAYRRRIAEVERATGALATGAHFPLAAAGGDGWGVAQAVTARGVLTHAVRLEAHTVTHYRVTAPTDVFFADASALSALLDSRRFASSDEAKRSLRLAVLALDPCLPYVLEVNDA
jgi:uptake hydrogenase large subunit